MGNQSAIYACKNCAVPRRFNTHASAESPTKTTCSVCDTPDAFQPIPFTSGYDAPHLLQIWVRADSLGRSSGVASVRNQLQKDVLVDVDNLTAMQDLAAFLETRIAELTVDYLRETREAA